MKNIVIVISSLVFMASACNSSKSFNTQVEQVSPPKVEALEFQLIDFISINPNFKFSAELPKDWLVEYIPATDSLNIYDPNYVAESNLEKSRIFIRNFTADKFLTLSTVDILNREEIKISGKQAVKYEIKKKPSVANFPNQPKWRSEQHRLIDIRLTDNNPSIFYVFAYSPDLNSEIFNTFISTLKY